MTIVNIYDMVAERIKKHRPEIVTDVLTFDTEEELSVILSKAILMANKKWNEHFDGELPIDVINTIKTRLSEKLKNA